MSTITDEVAALLRRRGYDARPGQCSAVGEFKPEDYVIVRAVTVVGCH